MNSIDLRKYWVEKFEQKFSDRYISDKYSIELSLLKRLIGKYDFYVALEATDRYFHKFSDKRKCKILFFASKKFFEIEYKDLIKENGIIKFQRLLAWYGSEQQNKVRQLIQRYRNFLYAISLSEEDILEMKNILNELEKIPMEDT